MPVTNGLAYFAAALAAKKKSLMTVAPGWSLSPGG